MLTPLPYLGIAPECRGAQWQTFSTSANSNDRPATACLFMLTSANAGENHDNPTWSYGLQDKYYPEKTYRTFLRGSCEDHQAKGEIGFASCLHWQRLILVCYSHNNDEQRLLQHRLHLSRTHRSPLASNSPFQIDSKASLPHKPQTGPVMQRYTELQSSCCASVLRGYFNVQVAAVRRRRALKRSRRISTTGHLTVGLLARSRDAPTTPTGLIRSILYNRDKDWYKRPGGSAARQDAGRHCETRRRWTGRSRRADYDQASSPSCPS